LALKVGSGTHVGRYGSLALSKASTLARIVFQNLKFITPLPAEARKHHKKLAPQRAHECQTRRRTSAEIYPPFPAYLLARRLGITPDQRNHFFRFLGPGKYQFATYYGAISRRSNEYLSAFNFREAERLTELLDLPMEHKGEFRVTPVLRSRLSRQHHVCAFDARPGLIALIAALIFVVPAGAELTLAAPASADPPRTVINYKLAPGDRISVVVVGQAEISGEYPVDGAGNILFPLIGTVEVKGLTLSECQNRILERLSDGIFVRPAVIVRVVELRPIQVLGDVRTPGSYPFRYGQIVKSAIAQAGGFGGTEPSAAIAEFLLADERVRSLDLALTALLIRQARLQAQIDGAKTFTPPSSPLNDANTAKIVEEETEAFARESEAFEKQINLIQSQKPQLLSEDEAIGGQITSEEKQLDIVQRQLDEYNKLADKGYGRSSSMLEYKLSFAGKQSNIWRLKAERSRLRVNIMEFDARLLDLETSRKKQLLSELQDVRQRIRDAEIALPSAREIRQARLRQTGGLVGAADLRELKITRLHGAEVSTFAATETTFLEPGDIVEIKTQRPSYSRPPVASMDTNTPPKASRPAGLAQQ
jgi:polysaccharide export outer membrane protein